jgi:hypothetical protein
MNPVTEEEIVEQTEDFRIHSSIYVQHILYFKVLKSEKCK